MRLLFLGDSITEGVGATTPENSYVNLVAKTLPCEVVNYGISGTRISRQTNPTVYATRRDLDFQLRATTMPKEADVVFVFGGINDFQHGDALLGDLNSQDPYFFCGGVRCLLEYLIATYEKKKLCVLLPPRLYQEGGRKCKGVSGTEQGADYGVYIRLLEAITTEYAIDIIDLYRQGYPKPMSDAGDTYTTDGIHPTDAGHKLIAEKICKYLEERKQI